MSNVSKTLAVCGLGWLGQPLARYWQQQGHSVCGTRRNPANCHPLQEAGIAAYPFTLGESLPEAVSTADILVLNIPAGRKNLDAEGFWRDMTNLVSQVSGATHLVFISTTSVFGHAQGQVDEHTPPRPDTDSGRLHWQLEQWMSEQRGDNLTVLRLAGLIGPNRHPVHFLAGRDMSQGQHPVNLIHQTDVVQALDRIINGAGRGKTLHLSANAHPSREQFYTWAAQEKGLTPPVFQRSASEGKCIDSRLSQQWLDMELTYASPFAMPIDVN